METVRSLEYKLNGIIEDEIEKDVSEMDDRLVLECCDGILRMDNIEKYLITREQFLKNKMAILGEKISKRHKTVKVLLVAAIIAALHAYSIKLNISENCFIRASPASSLIHVFIVSIY